MSNMRNFLIKILKRLTGDTVRLVELSEHKEFEILHEMQKIDRIDDYFNLLKQAGYQLYGQTNEKKYLGWVEQANHILINMKISQEKIAELENVKEPIKEDEGFKSSIEE